jgi:hypothetical protein
MVFLGKLIHYKFLNYPLTRLNQTEYLKEMKEWRKEIKVMEKDWQKLYALILQHLNEDSLEEVKLLDE